MEMVLNNPSFVSLSEEELMELAGRFHWHDFAQSTVSNGVGGAASGAVYGALGGTLTIPGIGTVGGWAAGAGVGFVAGAAWGATGYLATCWW